MRRSSGRERVTPRSLRHSVTPVVRTDESYTDPATGKPLTLTYLINMIERETPRRGPVFRRGKKGATS